MADMIAEKSLEYLSRHISLTESVIKAAEKHAKRYGLHVICAYYKDMEDFFSDWTGIGYTRTEARQILHGRKGEFLKLPNNLGYVRFV